MSDDQQCLDSLDDHQPAPFGQSGEPAPKSGTDGVSMAALITGICSLGVVPIILGILGLKRTKTNGTSGSGLAITGIVLGVLGTIAWTVAVIGIVSLANNVDNMASAGHAFASQAAVAAQDAKPSSGPEASTGSPARMSAAAVPQVEGFTRGGLVIDDAAVAGGAVGAYRATYTNGAGTVEAGFAVWPSADKTQAWAATQDARFTPEQLVKSSGAAGSKSQVRHYLVHGVSTVVAASTTQTIIVSGPADVVTAFCAVHGG